MKRKTKIVRVTPAEPLAPPPTPEAAELRWTMASDLIHRRRHPGPRGPRAGPQAPGMYIGGTDSTGYHHLLWEIVDNSVDEVINGYATRIEVTLHKDGKTVTVDGQRPRHPVDIMPKFKKPALELILTTLHAGGKFEQRQLQGLGRPARRRRVGGQRALEQADRAGQARRRALRADATSAASRRRKLKKVGPARGTGTTITFRARPGDLRQAAVRRRDDPRAARGQGVPPQGLDIVFTRRGRRRRRRRSSTRAASPSTSPSSSPSAASRRPRRRSFYFERAGEKGFRIEVALQWTEAHDETIRSYVNGIPTHAGRHARARASRAAIVKAVRNYIETHELDAQGRDAHRRGHPRGRRRRSCRSYVHEPQFQGQTKDRLNNPEVAGAGRRRGAPGARAAASTRTGPSGAGRSSRASIAGGAGARGVARGGAGGVAQDARSRTG